MTLYPVIPHSPSQTLPSSSSTPKSPEISQPQCWQPYSGSVSGGNWFVANETDSCSVVKLMSQLLSSDSQAVHRFEMQIAGRAIWKLRWEEEPRRKAKKGGWKGQFEDGIQTLLRLWDLAEFRLRTECVKQTVLANKVCQSRNFLPERVGVYSHLYWWDADSGKIYSPT